MKTEIHLGKCVKFGTAQGVSIRIKKHSWDCNWYFGFGYIGNNNLHTHFDTVFLKDIQTDINANLLDTKITQNDWWILLDLFNQAYTLKHAYNLYYLGNAHYSADKKSKVVHQKNQVMIETLKTDLENVLNVIWDFLTEIDDRQIEA